LVRWGGFDDQLMEGNRTAVTADAAATLESMLDGIAVG
jgi:hypothetical protein